jgi:tRNA modification GTPase
VVDDASGAAADDRALLAGLPPGVVHIVVHNKIDRAAAEPRVETIDATMHLWLSAKSGAGLDLLASVLKRHAGHVDAGAGAFTARARHVDALQRARAHFDAAEATLDHGAGAELAAEELRPAHQALAEITGEFTPDDLLGAIFSTFCIGK